MRASSAAAPHAWSIPRPSDVAIAGMEASSELSRSRTSVTMSPAPLQLDRGIRPRPLQARDVDTVGRNAAYVGPLVVLAIRDVEESPAQAQLARKADVSVKIEDGIARGLEERPAQRFVDAILAGSGGADDAHAPAAGWRIVMRAENAVERIDRVERLIRILVVAARIGGRKPQAEPRQVCAKIDRASELQPADSDGGEVLRLEDEK